MKLTHIQESSGAAILLNLSTLDFDDASFQQALSDNQQQKMELIEKLVEVLSPQTTGVILEPLTGFDAILKKDRSVGLLLSLVEDSSDRDPAEDPIFFPNWGVEYVRHNYGVAHLKMYYHPHEPLATKKQQIVAEIFDHCHYEDIDLMLELNLFALDNKKTTLEEFQNTQLEAVIDMRDKCNLIGLEYPHSALACATLTAELDIPWVLLDRTPDYDEFKEQVRTALEAGASGIAVGQVLWNEMTADNYQELINAKTRDRMIELSRIVEENVGSTEKLV